MSFLSRLNQDHLICERHSAIQTPIAPFMTVTITERMALTLIPDGQLGDLSVLKTEQCPKNCGKAGNSYSEAESFPKPAARPSRK